MSEVKKKHNNTNKTQIKTSSSNFNTVISFCYIEYIQNTRDRLAATYFVKYNESVHRGISQRTHSKHMKLFSRQNTKKKNFAFITCFVIFII